MGHISFVGKFDANMFAAGAPKLVPGITLEIMAHHSLDFWITSEDLPDPRTGSRSTGTVIMLSTSPTISRATTGW